MNASVTDGHEVSTLRDSREEHIGRILHALDTDELVSQRSLARELGIALGLTNLLIRRLVKQGLVRVARVQRHRVRYLLTPAGIAEKARMSQVALRQAVDRYCVARRRLEVSFAEVSRAFGDVDGRDRTKPVMFFGTGEIAEIGFVCLQDSDLQLVGVFDDRGRTRFFGVPVHPAADLQALLARHHHARIIVVTLGDRARVLEALAAARVPADRVHWV